MYMKAVLTFSLAFILINGSPLPCRAFGLLSHQAIIDAAWEKSITPALKEKYPNSTDKEIKEARAYVYGGSILPDIGYMPMGSTEFTHLVHYIRTGDFVNSLLEGAENINEYAFALGMMSHYYADNYGHPLGTNRVVPLMFPKEKEKHGEEVSYEEARIKHVRVEFGFDVLQTAKGRYKPEAYHDFIGFKVSEPVLARAFLKTYGLELNQVFGSFKASVNTFRFAVRNLVPELTRDAWKVRKSFINKLNPLATEENFYYNMKRSDYNKEFGKVNIKSTVVSFIIGVLPKIGPLSALSFKEPTEKGEKLYNDAFETIVTKYSNALTNPARQNAEDKNFDTGKKLKAGEYELADKSYDKLLLKLKKNDFKNADGELKNALAEFYAGSKKNDKPKRIREALTALK
jgi:hypothetical protein